VWFRRSSNIQRFFVTIYKQMILGILLAFIAGCQQRSAEITGGTPGTLRFGSQTIGDLVVVLHRGTGTTFEQVGFGRTSNAGEFQLVVQGKEEPLLLPPGDYVVTLESLGPPITFPKEYIMADNAVLKVSWTDSSAQLDLQAPETLLAPLNKM